MLPSNNGPTVSIVIPSYGRLALLKQAVAVTRATVRSAHEIIVVGGACECGVETWVRQQAGVKFVRETNRVGYVRALNMGLREAAGRFVTWLHDDARPLTDAIDAAVRAIKRPDFVDVGVVWFFETNIEPRSGRAQTYAQSGVEYAVSESEGSPYAHFGLMRREELVGMGLIDERFYASAWELDLTLRTQRDYGRRAVTLRESRIAHGVDAGAKLVKCTGMVERDLQRLSLKWGIGTDNGVPSAVPPERAKELPPIVAPRIVAPPCLVLH